MFQGPWLLRTRGRPGNPFAPDHACAAPPPPPVRAEKHAAENKNRPTEIICKFFLEAVEKVRQGAVWRACMMVVWALVLLAGQGDAGGVSRPDRTTAICHC